jgi:hypothetical protein
MSGRFRRWMVGTFLLGAMAFATAPGAQAQYRRDNDRDRRDNDDYRYGQRGNVRDFQREIQFLEQRIQRDRDQVRFESRRFGRNSFQARAAREQQKRDERELKELKKEWKRAQKDRRYYGNNRDNRNYRY